jgi:macrolide-specific efflux system membrane fusion protein
VLANLDSLQLVVPLSESEIGDVKVGQTASVTIEALSGRKVAAHVHSVDALSTSNSGVVSYDVTFQLDQLESGLKVGMSATAEVVVKQAEGLNVPTTAISGGTVTVVRSGKHVSEAVTTGLAGDSSTIVTSGLKAGEEIVLPSATTTATSSTSSSSSRSGSSTRFGGLAGGSLGSGGGLAGGGPPGR